jgi:hypothetical protein
LRSESRLPLILLLFLLLFLSSSLL